MEQAGFVMGVFLVLVAIVLAYRLKRRQHERQNEFGVERFPSYRDKLMGKAIDGLMWLGSIACLSAGAIAIGFSNLDTWGWILIAPVAVWFIFPWTPR